MKHIYAIGLIGSMSLLTACSGGGTTEDNSTSGNGSGSGGTTDTTLQWTQNQFSPEVDFFARCANPRSGINPATDQAYPDQAGSTEYEQFWLRSWANNSYLWYDEVTDKNPADFSTITDYYAQLKTTATTASGNDKDNFHFLLDTETWQGMTTSGSSLSYGINFVIIDGTIPRNILVKDTEPSANIDNVKRGYKLVAINDVDVVNTNSQSDIDLINAALNPQSNNESYQFTFEVPNTGNDMQVTLAAAEITVSPVKNVKTLTTEQGKIGYLQFDTFIQTSEKALYDAFTQLKNENISELVLDLRYNGGGYLAISSQLAYMIASQAKMEGKFFEKTIFNDKHTVTDPITGQTIVPLDFIDTAVGFSLEANTPLPNLGLERVYVLTTDNTCSASEALMNGLRGIDIEVIQIGSTTCGKPYGFYPTDNCGITYFNIQFEGINAKNFGSYSDGFTPSNNPQVEGVSVPGCVVADDFEHQLGDSNEAMLSAALNYQATGTCPVISMSAVNYGLKNQDSNTATSDLEVKLTPSTQQQLFNNKLQ
ncbi:S41 family peptidase [Shewanella marina]|uniref:S41 family peptidase n=1 Tax=Shewanella marina TaxID=487319 RepID=UPI00056BC7C0|nr:S41 family peptidase [Shewanella marina]